MATAFFVQNNSLHWTLEFPIQGPWRWRVAYWQLSGPIDPDYPSASQIEDVSVATAKDLGVMGSLLALAYINIKCEEDYSGYTVQYISSPTICYK